VSATYLPLWLADRGLTAAQIGQVLGLSQLLRVLVIPLIGRTADAVGHRRIALAATAVVAMGAILLMPVASLTGPLFAVACIQGVAAAAMTPLGDSVALPLANAGRLDYGRTRAWGSVGYMAAAAGGGALLGAEGTRAVPPLLAMIYLIAALLGLMMPEISRLAHTRREQASPFRSPRFRLAVLASALIQGAHAAYYNFAALRWRAAGIPDGIVGLLVAEGIVAEVALFVWGRTLIERIGPGRLTMVAALVSVVRWMALAVVVDVRILAILQLLHAGTFALQHLSAMLVLRQVGAGRAATAQTWLAALGGSLPGAALTWLAGRLYGRDPGSAFLAMAVVAALALPVGARLRRLAPTGEPASL
jgi:MFS transporter, PPP family, 3-phenylpropionic acid transporter